MNFFSFSYLFSVDMFDCMVEWQNSERHKEICLGKLHSMDVKRTECFVDDDDMILFLCVSSGCRYSSLL